MRNSQGKFFLLLWQDFFPFFLNFVLYRVFIDWSGSDLLKITNWERCRQGGWLASRYKRPSMEKREVLVLHVGGCMKWSACWRLRISRCGLACFSAHCAGYSAVHSCSEQVRVHGTIFCVMLPSAV